MLEYIVKMLVENKEAVKVGHKVDEMGVLLTVECDKADMGKIIGREGNTAKAIRTIMRAYGMGQQQRINVKIAEPEGSTHPQANHKHASDLDIEGLGL